MALRVMVAEYQSPVVRNNDTDKVKKERSKMPS